VKFKIDECISPRAAAICRLAGHDATTTGEEGLNGRPDADVLTVASAEGRVVITVDRGFGDSNQYPPGTHAGIIVLRPEDDDKELFLAFLEDVLKNPGLEWFAGCIVIVEPDRTRIRRPTA
jgi:predicted nuclease of predicted toxin-antitoxin system